MMTQMNKKHLNTTKLKASLASHSIVITSSILIIAWLLFAPSIAYADTLGFSSIIQQLQYVATVLLLPIAIILCAWRILYIALFGGLLGIDPFNQISDTDIDAQISTSEVWEALKSHFIGFVHGMCWIGGIFIIFQIALTLASVLASTLDANFG